MKFETYFNLFMRMPPQEKRVAQSLSPRYFALNPKKFMDEVRRRTYGSLYPRTAVIGKRLQSARQRAQSRRARSKKPRSAPFRNMMEY